MAGSHEGGGDRHRGTRYAASGYPEGQRPDGNVPERYRSVGAVFRGGK